MSIEDVKAWLKEVWQNNKGFIAAVAAILIARSILVDQYHVPSGSMIPNIMIGDRLLVNKAAYQIRVPFTHWIVFKTGEPQRGDILIFDHPDDSKVMVKRLIGLPGDEITLRDANVFVNGTALLQEEVQKPENKVNLFFYEKNGDRRYIIERTPFRINPNDPEFKKVNNVSYRIPEGEYFFMGDNRENSADSRYWGFVPRKLIKGRALRVTFSLHGWSPRWDRFGHNLYEGPTEFAESNFYDQ